MPVYRICNVQGEVQKAEPKNMTQKQADQANRDLHVQGYPMAWIKADRIEKDKVVRLPSR